MGAPPGSAIGTGYMGDSGTEVPSVGALEDSDTVPGVFLCCLLRAACAMEKLWNAANFEV